MDQELRGACFAVMAVIDIVVAAMCLTSCVDSDLVSSDGDIEVTDGDASPDSGEGGGPPISEECGDDCLDGLDNDGDGYADCDDWSCSFDILNSVCEEREVDHTTIDTTVSALCSDGIDNDGDGYIDCDDRDCRWHERVGCICHPGGECTDEKCDDGLDNNGDGHVDCDDWECRFNRNVTVCARPCG